MFFSLFKLIGFTLTILIFLLESAVAFLCKKFSEYQILIQDAFMLICLLATVNVWRGIWMLLDIFGGN